MQAALQVKLIEPAIAGFRAVSQVVAWDVGADDVCCCMHGQWQGEVKQCEPAGGNYCIQRAALASDVGVCLGLKSVEVVVCRVLLAYVVGNGLETGVGEG